MLFPITIRDSNTNLSQISQSVVTRVQVSKTETSLFAKCSLAKLLLYSPWVR